jgi:DNA topoisomerase-6 subunit B
MSKGHREISVSQFFEKNRHLLGFDNKRKALMTTIKEAVDNSLDACEEAGILPEISVEIVDMGNDRFRVIVEDNGPGIIKEQIPKVFAKLLYGSKFHKMRQSRGQQGIGISASVMYAQLTTGRPAKITSTVGKGKKAHYYELHIDTNNNKPEIVKDETVDWKRDHGTRVELDLEASYQGGSQSVDEYLKETAIVNPHLTLTYTNPKAEQIIFPCATKDLPTEAKEIKPHPYGVEFGIMFKMLKNTDARTLQSFLSSEFSRVGSGTAKKICEASSLVPGTKPRTLSREQVEQLMAGIKEIKLIGPPTDCLSPITAELMEKGLKKEINAEFYTAVTRPTAVYRGNPFQIEVGIAYGGDQSGDKTIKLIRFANRVPLLYQLGGCAFTKSAIHTAWRNYGLSQSRGALPIGPLTVAIHISSVWVPYTSESKEALAHYPDIMKEIKLALQEAGRQLGSYVNKKKRINAEGAKRDYIEKFIPHVAEALKELLKLKGTEVDAIKKNLKDTLEVKRGVLEDVKFDPKKNLEYDPELAKIGKDAPEEDTSDIGFEDKNEKGQKKLSNFKNK